MKGLTINCMGADKKEEAYLLVKEVSASHLDRNLLVTLSLKSDPVARAGDQIRHEEPRLLACVWIALPL